MLVSDLKRRSLQMTVGLPPGFSYEWPLNMRPATAAKYMGVSKAFLDQSRCSGSGPRFVRVSKGMILYRRDDLDAWLADRSYLSTAEADRAERESGAA